MARNIKRKNEAQNGQRKKAKVEKPVAEPEYFAEKRNLEDLWKQVFSVGTEWENMDAVYEHNWDFSNLENAFEEGGELHNKKVYLFGGTEAVQLPVQDGEMIRLKMIPFVAAVVSPFPPSDKIGITSVQMAAQELVPMKRMKMDWIPYIPLDKRVSQVERLKNPQIFIWGCTQRRSALRHLKIERLYSFQYCIPYFYDPFKEDDLELDTVVEDLYPNDPTPVSFKFDWEFDELEEFTDKMIEEEELPADQKEPFKEFVMEKVREAKRKNREAREAKRKAREELGESKKAAFENMKFLKFYPVPTPDTPDVVKKSNFINRYYPKAHMVF